MLLLYQIFSLILASRLEATRRFTVSLSLCRIVEYSSEEEKLHFIVIL